MKYLFCFFLLCAQLWFPHAVLAASDHEQNSCSLPEPAGLVVQEKGTNWAKLRWYPVNTATGYRIRAYKAPTNTLVIDTTVNALSVVLKGLTPGASYKFTAAAVCSNGYSSNLIAAVKETIIVIDLILKYSGTPQQMLPLTSGACMETTWYPPAGYDAIWMEFEKNGALAFLKIETTSPTHISVTTSATSGSFSLFIQEDETTGNLWIYDMDDPEQTLICVLTGAKINSLQPNILLCTESLNADYSVSYFWGDWVGFQDSNLDDRAQPTTKAEILRIYGNPVSDVIDMQFDTGIQPAQIRLNDQFGRVIWVMQLNPENGRLQIPVSDLPHGIYYFSVQAGQVREVVKLVK